MPSTPSTSQDHSPPPDDVSYSTSDHQHPPSNSHPIPNATDVSTASGTPRRRDFGSPEVLRRAGLLQPMAQSYASTSVFPPQDHVTAYNTDPSNGNTTARSGVYPSHLAGPAKKLPHSLDAIRESTVQLSNMLMVSNISPSLSPPTFESGPNTSQYIFPTSSTTSDAVRELPVDPQTEGTASSGTSRDQEDDTSLLSLPTDLMSSSGSLSSSTAPEHEHPPPQPSLPISSGNSHPSGLSLLLRSQGSSPEDSAPTPKELRSPVLKAGDQKDLHGQSVDAASLSPEATPKVKPTGTLSPVLNVPSSTGGYGTVDPSSTHLPPPSPSSLSKATALPTDRTPLLLSTIPEEQQNGVLPAENGLSSFPISLHSIRRKLRNTFNHGPKRILTAAEMQHNAAEAGRAALKAIPAVILGCLLNILDGLSYGMIAFPSSPPFENEPPSVIGFDGASTGVSLFFLTTIVAQLVYTFGGSGFVGANGSMMIEVVPFFHILGTSIAKRIGYETEEQQRMVVATTLASFVLSSIFTGITFFVLGAFKLGAIIGFFPRHILVGCIGGVGLFLIETGLTVSLRISDDEFEYNLSTLKMFFESGHAFALWSIPLALAVLLRIITTKWNHQLLFPIYFLIIPVAFYIVVAAARLNLDDLRKVGWVFDVGTGASEASAHWYSFYSYLKIQYIDVPSLVETIPTQLALLFFNILHPPLNVPALSVSLNQDIDTNKELVAHGYSNLFAGIIGTVPNYLVYVNTLLFYRVGGGQRIAGFMLAMATVVLLCIGTGPISFIPVMVVGALIFVLGIDLVKEALWDTRHRVSRLEYITIISIMVCMTIWDFVIGVLFGIIMSCFFFVVQNSHRKSIRAFHTGETVMSTVRRPTSQRDYVREVSKQTTILRLQGFLFFGTITYVEEAVRNAIEGPGWARNPVRFLILDLTLVSGVDMSAAEAFVRIHRILSARCVILVFCGFKEESPIGQALASVDVLGAQGVELFSTFNQALEWTENAYLRAWMRSHKAETTAWVLPGRQDADIQLQASLGSFAASPRLSHMHDAGIRTIAQDLSQPTYPMGPEPFNTLVKAFSSFDVDFEQLQPLAGYFERVIAPDQHTLWHQGDPPDGIYLLESGILRATYSFAEYTQSIEESMVPGTLAGELSALSELPRNATTVAERQSVLWKMSQRNLTKLQTERPQLARLFVDLVVKSAKIDYDILLSALAARQ